MVLEYVFGDSFSFDFNQIILYFCKRIKHILAVKCEFYFESHKMLHLFSHDDNDVLRPAYNDVVWLKLCT